MMSILGDCLWRPDSTQVADCTREYLAEPVCLVLPWGIWLFLTLIVFSLFWIGFWLLYYRAMAQLFGDEHAGLKPFDWIGERIEAAIDYTQAGGRWVRKIGRRQPAAEPEGERPEARPEAERSAPPKRPFPTDQGG